MEDMEEQAVLLFDEFLVLLLAFDERDIGALLLIQTGLAVYRVVHYLEELLSEVVLSCCEQGRLLLDFWG